MGERSTISDVIVTTMNDSQRRRLRISREFNDWLHDAVVASENRYSVNVPVAHGLKEAVDIVDDSESQSETRNIVEKQDGQGEDDELYLPRDDDRDRASSSEGVIDNKQRLLHLTKPGINILKSSSRFKEFQNEDLAYDRVLVDDESDATEDEPRQRQPALPGGSAASALDPPHGIAGLPESWIVKPSTDTSSALLPSDATKRQDEQKRDLDFLTNAEDVVYETGHGQQDKETNEGDNVAECGIVTQRHDDKDASALQSMYDNIIAPPVLRPAPSGAIAGMPETWREPLQQQETMPQCEALNNDNADVIPDSCGRNDTEAADNVLQDNDNDLIVVKESRNPTMNDPMHGKENSEQTNRKEEYSTQNRFRVSFDINELDSISVMDEVHSVTFQSKDVTEDLQDYTAKDEDNTIIMSPYIVSKEIANARRASRIYWEDKVQYHHNVAKVAEARALKAETLSKNLTAKMMHARDAVEVQTMLAEEESTRREKAELEMLQAQVCYMNMLLKRVYFRSECLAF